MCVCVCVCVKRRERGGEGNKARGEEILKDMSQKKNKSEKRRRKERRKGRVEMRRRGGETNRITAAPFPFQKAKAP